MKKKKKRRRKKTWLEQSKVIFPRQKDYPRRSIQQEYYD
jgi:hypothetical protein